MNDNQNAYVRPGRTTSRVLAPSGGQSSLTFGILPTPVVKATPAAPTTPVVEDVAKNETSTTATTIESKTDDTNCASGNAVLNDVDDTTTKLDKIEENMESVSASKAPAKFTSALLPSQVQDESKTISQNAFVSGSNMNGGCVMTGRSSSRVLAPPGGHTSIKLG